MKWVLELLFSSQKSAIELLIASLFINLFGLASAVYVMQVYGRFLVHGISTTLITLFVGMILIISLDYLLRKVRFNIASKLIKKRDTKESYKLIDTLLNIKALEFISIKESTKRAIISRNDEMLNTLNTPLFITILDTPFAIIYIFAIFFISVSIGWIVLSLIILTLVVTYLLSIKIGENTKKSLDANIEKNSYALSIEHTELIKANGAKNLIEENYKKGFNSALDLKNLIQQEQSKLQNMNLTMSMLLSALVIAFGAKEVVDGNIDFGMLIGINILSAKAIMILTKPVSSISNIIKHKDTKEFIDKFMSMKQDKKDGLIIKNFDSNMEIKDISFGYGNGPIIRNLTVEIKKGSLVKIIGSNGRGKTTLCRLLCGMFEPKVGNILVDGIDLRQIDTNWWSSKVSYIPQEPEFINSTIKENILMMNSEIDDSRISNIIKDADLENFINLSTDGLNMKISNSARDLPVGIRRRLSLARAIANDGDIVIIDEPTDGLDQQGVKAIANYVNSSLSNKKTVIVATHSLNLINNEKIIIDLNSKIAKVKYNV